MPLCILQPNTYNMDNGDGAPVSREEHYANIRLIGEERYGGKIRLQGWGVDRNGIRLNDLPLPPQYSQMVRRHSDTGYNWGYAGSGPAQLALAIMLVFETKERALALYQTFKATVIALLPNESFDVLIDLPEWLRYTVPGHGLPPKHAYDFIDFSYIISGEPKYLPKWMDFPYIQSFSVATFSKDTLQYELLKGMSGEDFKAFKAYLKRYTNYTDPREGRAIWMEISYEDDTYTIINGKGRGVYVGSKTSDNGR